MPRSSASTMIWTATISFRAPEMRTTLPSQALLRARSGCSTASRSTFSPSFTAQACLTSADAGEAKRSSAITKRGRVTSDEYRRFERRLDLSCAGVVIEPSGAQIVSWAPELAPLLFQKLTLVENVMRRIPDAVFGCRKNGDVMIPLYPE